MNIGRKEGQWFNNANGDTAMVSNGFQWRNYDSKYLDSNYRCFFSLNTSKLMENTTDRILRQCVVDKRFANVQARLYCPIDNLTLLGLDSTPHGTTHPLRYVILVNYYEPRSLVF